jgi:hypothetical protein
MTLHEHETLTLSYSLFTLAMRHCCQTCSRAVQAKHAHFQVLWPVVAMVVVATTVEPSAGTSLFHLFQHWTLGKAAGSLFQWKQYPQLCVCPCSEEQASLSLSDPAFMRKVKKSAKGPSASKPAIKRLQRESKPQAGRAQPAAEPLKIVDVASLDSSVRLAPAGSSMSLQMAVPPLTLRPWPAWQHALSSSFWAASASQHTIHNATYCLL